MGRHLHDVLRAGRAGVPRQCADDVAVFLHNIRFLAMLKPAFDEAERFVGIALKQLHPPMQRQRLRGCRRVPRIGLQVMENAFGDGLKTLPRQLSGAGRGRAELPRTEGQMGGEVQRSCEERGASRCFGRPLAPDGLDLS